MGMHERFRLDGKVAVVTGGGRGIGKGIAVAFAECGADVAVIARRQADVDEVAEQIRGLGRKSLAISADVMDWTAIPAALDRVVAELGGLDIMVNNAGGNLDRKMYPLPEIPIEKWDEQIDLNMKTKFWGSQQAAKRMKNGGRIINIISIAAHNASLGFGAYSSANNGMIAFTRTMAVELAPKKITVNCIAPGIVVTDMFKETLNIDNDAAMKMAADATPLGRTGYPEDVAAAACFFASPAAEWTTGQFLDVAGGR
ncbi:MAG: SDR family NAD(P)-dependent oxidoreductase [Sphingomonadales bacterium]